MPLTTRSSRAEDWVSRAKGVTSWWRTPSDILDGRTPLQELEDGDLTEVAVDNSDQRGQTGMVGEWGSCNGNPVRSSGTVINSVDSGCAAAAAQPTARVDPIIALHDVAGSPGPDAAETTKHPRGAILEEGAVSPTVPGRRCGYFV
ncbi:hypothetical protein [Rhodococcus sp. ACS1]|uniref:hypothetical protein n=1 Tax=Rhodococcus sp. ACS1 TaxID=2028570 RepID=UPI0015C9CB84|nr:hypothetical protein [Rhodococcus sp. ACS1]